MERPTSLNAKKITFITGDGPTRILHTVFEQMFRQEFGYNVYPNGYEYTHPDLVQAPVPSGTGNFEFERIRHQPDYRIYKPNTPWNTLLVELKYQTRARQRSLYQEASELSKYWPGSFIFLATDEDFYMDSCKSVKNNRGQIITLAERAKLGRLKIGRVKYYHDLFINMLGADHSVSALRKSYNGFTSENPPQNSS